MGTNQEVSQYLQRLSTKINDEFNLEVLKNKYAESKIENLSDVELLTKTAQCLLNIHVVTGWNLPDDKDYIKILTEQFLNKLKEDFHMLNFSEIYFAFRKAVGKKDWGKNINLELICSVLGAYCVDRSIVSFEEEKINSMPETMKIYTDEEILNERRGEIEFAFQAMKRGKLPLIHIYFEKVLKEDGLFIEGENVSEFFVRKLNNQSENIYKRA